MNLTLQGVQKIVAAISSLAFVLFISLEGISYIYQKFYPVPLRQNIIFGAQNGRDNNFILQPNSDGTYSVTLKPEEFFVDSIGRKFSVIKPKGCIRIVCLGGSETNGVGSDKTHSYPVLLNDLLNSYFGKCGVSFEVINSGYMGYHSWHSRLLMTCELINLNPDIVTVLQGPNDIETAAWINNFNDVIKEQRSILDAHHKNILERMVSRLNIKLKETIATYRLAMYLCNNINSLKWRRLTIEDKLDLFGYKDNIRSIVDFDSKNNIQTMILNYPWIVKPDDKNRAESPLLKEAPEEFKDGRNYFNKVNRDLSASTGAILVDLLSSFDNVINLSGKGIMEKIYHDHVHFTKEGNFLVVQSIASELMKLPLIREKTSECESLSLQEALTLLHPQVFFTNGWPEAPNEIQPLAVVKKENIRLVNDSEGPHGWVKYEVANTAYPAVLTLGYTDRSKQSPMPGNGFFNTFFYPRVAGAGAQVRVLSNSGDVIFDLAGQLNNSSWSGEGDKFGLNLPDLRPGDTITVELSGTAQVWCPPEGIFFTNDCKSPGN